MNLNKQNDIYYLKSKEVGEKVEKGERKNEAVRVFANKLTRKWVQDKSLQFDNRTIGGTTDNEYAICMSFKRIRYLELYGFEKYQYDLKLASLK